MDNDDLGKAMNFKHLSQCLWLFCNFNVSHIQWGSNGKQLIWMKNYCIILVSAGNQFSKHSKKKTPTQRYSGINSNVMDVIAILIITSFFCIRTRGKKDFWQCQEF